MEKLKILFLSFIGVLLVWSIGAFTGYAGENYPQRIVSLAPSITESLYQLEAQDCLIGVTFYCNYPPQAKTKETIGTLISPNIEKIYSLSPDLVLAVDRVNSRQQIDKLKNLGLEVVVFNESCGFEDILANFIQLGKLVGREEKAKEIAKKIKQEVIFITKKIKDSPRIKVFWEVGAKPLVTISAKSFANEFIIYSGGINIFADASMRYPRVSREEVLKRNPQVIILVTMGGVTAKEKDYWRQFEYLEAVKRNRIYVFDADKVCRPTPASFLTGLDEIARLLHPEALKERK